MRDFLDFMRLYPHSNSITGNLTMTTPHSSLLAEYAIGWCLHQLAPFLDQTFGVAGAMDHRMIDRSYDWGRRLPLILAVAAYPSRHMLLAAHIVNIISWFDRMPAVWDYMCWCALTELTFVVAALYGKSLDEVAKFFLPAVRAQLVVLYFSAAFWKLTTSWFDPHYSCATVLMSELLAGLEPVLPFVVYLRAPLMLGAPALVAGIEFAVPSLLLLKPRLGVLLALVFHQTINLMPTTYAGGFSIAMCARFVVFLPGCSTTLTTARMPLLSAALVGVGIALMIAVHGGLDFHGGIFLALALFYFTSISADLPQPQREMPAPSRYAIPKALIATALLVYGDYLTVALAIVLLTLWAPTPIKQFAFSSRGIVGFACLTGFVYGFVHPVLGVQMMASSTMYGNVKNYAGSNHMLVPTGMLQTALAEKSTTAPWWLQDFRDGFVRVESTNATALRQLAVNGADTTDQLPALARELLAQYNASGRYFQFYAARNYFDRKQDLYKSALKHVPTPDDSKLKSAEDPPYVVPAYELRRALSLARARGETFVLQYSRLPPELKWPTEWRAYRGPTVVHHEHADGGPRTCVVREGAHKKPCDESEIVLQPAPHWWLTKLLLPYPIPLLEGAGDGVHCST